MWNPQGIYSRYMLRMPAIVTGRGAVRELYDYPCARIAVIHGSSVSNEERFRETFAKKEIRFFPRSWAGEPDLGGISGTLRDLERFQPDTILAVGGGSVIDGAKLCRLFLEFPYYEPGSGRPVDSLFTSKFIAVPTTVGSGAEVSSAAVYVDSGTGSKQMAVMHGLQPDVIVYDAGYVKNAPVKLLCESALDALAHIVEGYVSNIENDIAGTVAESGLSVLRDEMGKAASGRWEEIDFGRLQYAGLAGGIVQNHCIVGAAHAVAHQLYKYGFSHGEAVALLLPAVIRLNMEEETAGIKYERLAERSGFGSVEGITGFIETLCRLGGTDSRKGELTDVLKTNLAETEFVNNIKKDRGGKGNPVEMTDEYIGRLVGSI